MNTFSTEHFRTTASVLYEDVLKTKDKTEKDYGWRIKFG